MAEFIRRKILFHYFWLTEHLQRKCDKTNTLAVSVMGTEKWSPPTDRTKLSHSYPSLFRLP